MADTIALGIRVHDPKEKAIASKSVEYISIDVDRADRGMDVDAFIAKYVRPRLSELKILWPPPSATSPAPAAAAVQPKATKTKTKKKA